MKEAFRNLPGTDGGPPHFPSEKPYRPGTSRHRQKRRQGKRSSAGCARNIRTGEAWCGRRNRLRRHSPLLPAGTCAFSVFVIFLHKVSRLMAGEGLPGTKKTVRLVIQKNIWQHTLLNAFYALFFGRFSFWSCVDLATFGITKLLVCS